MIFHFSFQDFARKSVFFAAAFCFIPAEASADSRLFQWKLEKNDAIELNEFHNVLFRFQNSEVRRQDKNRISLIVEDCTEKACRIQGRFDTYVRYGSGVQPFRKERTYLSNFSIQNNGTYIVPEEYAVPNLRSVPAFPEIDLSPGDTWILPAEESFDFQSGRFKVSVQAEYNWIGPEEWKWKEFSGRGEKITYTYPIFYSSGIANPTLPNKVYGISRGTVYFDPDRGLPQFKENKLSYTFVYPDGRVTEANFHIVGIYQSRKIMDALAKENLRERIRKDLGIEKPSGMEDLPENAFEPSLTLPIQPLQVRNTEEGISISMDSVLFDTDRYDLKEDAFIQLEKIAKVLKNYPDREIRVSGHTDNRGGRDYNLRLSENRAKTVVDALVKRFGIQEGRISYQGFGDSKPIESNSTERGRAKNRRVDITLVVE